MDKNQFTDILRIYQSAIISVIHKMVNSWDTARDLAQDSFLRLWNYRHKIKEDKPVFTLLYKIAVNLAIDHLRKNRDHFVDLASDMTLTTSESPDDNELYGIILALSNRLKPKQKAIFILRDIEGFSFEEITRILNMPVGNVRSNLHLARKNIKKSLESEYNLSREILYEL